MLTRLCIKNFKRFDDADIELGQNVVLIGPNNCGKTTALQALALWSIGVRKWHEKRGGKTSPEKRPGVTINRRDLISIPAPNTNLLWKGLHVRNVKRIEDKQDTQNIRIDVIVDGITNGKTWTCGLEFDYANDESFYCRPLRLEAGRQPKRLPVPEEAVLVNVAFLPPMSGLAAVESMLQPGKVNVLIGEGQTAQVLRNLCYQINSSESGEGDWGKLVNHINQLFGVDLLPPNYIAERGEITMAYKEADGLELDLSSSGRGLQQTLLLLAHLYANPGTVLLLDEPDAHLEILRQRQIYRLLTDVAEQRGSQIIAASHSEVVLNEAANRDVVVAFVGKPHRIDDRGSQLAKSLKEIGFDQYYQAEDTGWVLYLEGATDLSILRTWAKKLGHGVREHLERPFVYYVRNQPKEAVRHFYGLKEAKKNLVGIALFDRLDQELPNDIKSMSLMWEKREIENYFCQEEVLMAFARHNLPGDLFGSAEAKRRTVAMKEAIEEISRALKSLKKADPWSPDIKATDEFLDPLFDKYFEILGHKNLLLKSGYHVLAGLMPKERMDPEIKQKLDAILKVAKKATPRKD